MRLVWFCTHYPDGFPEPEGYSGGTARAISTRDRALNLVRMWET
jgi:hypothetical protein